MERNFKTQGKDPRFWWAGIFAFGQIYYNKIEKTLKKYAKYWSIKLCSYQPDINNQDPANKQEKELEDKFEKLTSNYYYWHQISSQSTTVSPPRLHVYLKILVNLYVDTLS